MTKDKLLADKEVAKQLVEVVNTFSKELEKTNLQHQNARAFGRVVEHFASELISNKLSSSG